MIAEGCAHGARQAGFTLLEVIVAFVIMGLVLGAAFTTFSTGLSNANLAGDYVGAVVRAESRLALLGIAERIEPGTTTGRIDDTYGWRQTIVPAETGAANGDTPPLYDVSMTVYWGRDATAREVTLRTLRLGRGAGR